MSSRSPDPESMTWELPIVSFSRPPNSEPAFAESSRPLRAALTSLALCLAVQPARASRSLLRREVAREALTVVYRNLTFRFACRATARRRPNPRWTAARRALFRAFDALESDLLGAADRLLV